MTFDKFMTVVFAVFFGNIAAALVIAAAWFYLVVPAIQDGLATDALDARIQAQSDMYNAMDAAK